MSYYTKIYEAVKLQHIKKIGGAAISIRMNTTVASTLQFIVYIC